MSNTPRQAPADELLEHGDGLIELDANWVVVRVNTAQERTTGKPRLDTLGRVFWDLWPEVADPRGAQWCAYHRCMEERVPVEVEDYYPPFNVWFHITAYPTSTGGIAVSFRDVTRQKRAEQSVRAERDFSTAILDTLATLVLVLDTDGRIVRFNAACERATGFASSEVLGKSVFELLIPESELPGTQAAFRRLRMGDFPNQHRNRWRMKDGTERLFDWSNTAIPDEHGGVRFIIATGVDITERERSLEVLRESEERLRRNEQRLRAIFDNAAIGIVEVDEQDRFVAVNRRFCAMLGYDRQQLIGRTLHEVTAPEDRELTRELNAKLHRGDMGEFEYEKRYLKRDGSRLWVQVNVRVVKDGEGRFIQAVGTAQDISERKRAEAELRDANMRLASHVETTPLGVVEWDSEYRVVRYSNRAREMFGWSAEEVLGKRIDEIPWVPEEDWPSVRAVMREMNTRTRPTNVNANRNLCRDGRLIDCEWYNSTLYDDSGQMRSVLSLVLDVTDRKRADAAVREANEKLRDADRRKDEFLGMLSHELRNPLAPIRNALYILDRGQPAGQQAHRAKDIVRRQVAHLTRLVDDLLDVTRIARGKIELRREELDLGDLVRRTAEDYRPVLQSRGLDLTLDVRADPILVKGDPARLTQVFGNLLNNAAKFTPTGGRVSVSLRPEGERAVAHVQDTGPGIAPDVLPTLFDPFTQGKQTLARAEGGLGLGLSLVKGLVTLHGGDVSVSSVPGGGADFVVRLDLCGPATVLEGRRRAVAPPATVTSRHRVLVVDDNRDSAESLGELVGMLGHEAELAYDGPTAIAQASRMQPDVVLCDIGLPGMDGYQVARELRARHDGDLRIVALSGYAQPEDVDRALEAGFDAHVAKPPDPEQLAQILEYPRYRPATDEPQPGVTHAP